MSSGQECKMMGQESKLTGQESKITVQFTFLPGWGSDVIFTFLTCLKKNRQLLRTLKEIQGKNVDFAGLKIKYYILETDSIVKW